MKLGVMRPDRVVDINELERTNAGRIEFGGNRLRLGALTRMSTVADHPDVRRALRADPHAVLRRAHRPQRKMNASPAPTFTPAFFSQASRSSA